MKKVFVLLLLMLSPTIFAQSQNFQGFGLSIDYALNSIEDISTPGGSATSKSGIPGVTADALKAINDQWLVGVYGTYELATTDTAGSDPDAYNPLEVGGKVGYAFTEKLMGYVKLGYAWSKYSYPSYYQWMSGPSYGIGAEYLITNNLFARIEIAQQNYKTVYWNDGSSDRVKIDSYGIALGWRF